MEGIAVNRSSRADPPPARPTGGLVELALQINQRIRQIEEKQDDMGQGLQRLVNPRPSSACENAKVEREPDTIEAQLQAILCRLESVLNRAMDQADTLNSAV